MTDMNPLNPLHLHYSLLLGLKDPWYVDDVNLAFGNTNPDQVVITLKHSPGRFKCSECGAECPVADHTKERTWRHLDTMQFQTYIVAAVPRTGCRRCGDKVVEVPWAVPHGRFTLMFEAFALIVIQNSKSYSAAANILRCSYDVVERIVEQAVERGLKRRGELTPKRIGIDEKAWRAGREGDSFATIVTDLESKTVLSLELGKDAAAATEAMAKITPQAQKAIEAVAIDLSPTFTAFRRNNTAAGNLGA